MTRYVIDAGVAVKWFLPDTDEPNTLEALDLFLRLRAAEISLLQPPHWKAEVAAVLARRFPETAASNIDDLNLLEGIEIDRRYYDKAAPLGRSVLLEQLAT